MAETSEKMRIFKASFIFVAVGLSVGLIFHDLIAEQLFDLQGVSFENAGKIVLEVYLPASQPA